MFDLCQRDDKRLYYAPWRPDPRPIEALLQGAYAHIAVTDFWRVRRHELVGGQARTAEKQFARWRMDTAEAIETLAGSGAFTDARCPLRRRMRATVAPWLDEPVDAAAPRRRGGGPRPLAALGVGGMTEPAARPRRATVATAGAAAGPPGSSRGTLRHVSLRRSWPAGAPAGASVREAPGQIGYVKFGAETCRVLLEFSGERELVMGAGRRTRPPRVPCRGRGATARHRRAPPRQMPAFDRHQADLGRRYAERLRLMPVERSAATRSMSPPRPQARPRPTTGSSASW